MNLSRFLRAFAAALLLVAPLCSPLSSVAAQQQGAPPAGSSPTSPDAPAQPVPPEQDSQGGTRTPPVPAARGVFVGSAEDSQQPGDVVPDTNVASSAGRIGLGLLYSELNIFEPTLFGSESIQTGIVANRWQPSTTFGGTLRFRHTWHASQIAISYNGGDSLYHSGGSYSNSPYQQMDASGQIRWGRFVLKLLDSVVLTPQSPFGGLTTGGPALIGQTPAYSNFVPTITPAANTILTGWGNQISNVALAELHYSLSRRSTVSVSGSQQELHFFNSGYVNSAYEGAQVGYNYALSAKDSVAVTYNFTYTNYGSTTERQLTHLAQLNFSRKITGRLAFQVSAGPQWTIAENSGQPNSDTLTWGGFTSLTYRQPRNIYSIALVRAFSGGSGVFYGANTDTVSASVSRRFTRFWTGSVSGGYSRSDSLPNSQLFTQQLFTQQLTTQPAGQIATRFNTWYVSTNATRQVGRHLNLALGYAFEGQSSNGVCPVFSCGVATAVHNLSINVNWHLRPIG